MKCQNLNKHLLNPVGYFVQNFRIFQTYHYHSYDRRINVQIVSKMHFPYQDYCLRHIHGESSHVV